MGDDARRTGGIGKLALIGVALIAACGQAPEDGADGEEAASEDVLALRAGAPRLLSPLSATIATSRRPMFRWFGAHDDHVRIDVCRDRACDRRIVSFTGRGGDAFPPRPLPAGVVFWRATRLGHPHGHAHGRTSLVWQLVIPARDSGRSGSWGAVPDFNGDGFSDLEVTSVGIGSPPAPPDVRIFNGGPDGPAATPSQVFTDVFGFGFESGPVGDLDGDGFCDLAVWSGFGAPNSVTVFRGGPAGISAPVVIPTPEVAIGAQARVVTAGDVNRDGYADMLVGGGAFAQLFLGGRAGVARTAALNLPSLSTDAQLVIGGADFNGDGNPDAIVGSISGGGQLFFGNGRTLVPGGPFQVGFSGLAGDFNADGFADLANGVVQTGGPTGAFTTFQAIAGTSAYATAGDTNADGFSDVLTSISSLFGVPEGQRLYFGGRIGCTTTECPRFVPLLVPGTLSGGPFIATGAGGVGDLNGDGFDDVAYFQPGEGTVYLLFGSRAGPPATPSRTITAEQGFGFSVGHL
jgi:VCBS repeat protein/FG-GAP repeat protein